MKNSLKKLLCGICALAFSAAMFSAVAFADETENASAAAAAGDTADMADAAEVTEEVIDQNAVLLEADNLYNMIKDESVPDSEPEFIAANLMSQGLLSEVAYHLETYTDAPSLRPNVFAAIDDILDFQTDAVLGEEAADDENAVAETQLLDTNVYKHTYEIDKAAGLTSADADSETYGVATSVVQTFKKGTNTLTSITWAFNLAPMSEEDTKKAITVKAIAEGGQEDGGNNYQEFNLPTVEVNGEFTIGIILNGWVPEGESRVVEDTSFVTTMFEYADADTADVTDEETVTDAAEDETAEEETVTDETVEELETAEEETAEVPVEEAVETAADAE